MSETATSVPVKIGKDHIRIGGFGTRLLAGGELTKGAYALLEHTLEPGLIGAVPHRHSREEELSYVLSGNLTVWREGVVVTFGPGSVIPKPRGEWHTFWNAGSETVRFLEHVSPPAFVSYFRDIATALSKPGPPDMAALGAVAASYGLEFDFAVLGSLLEEHKLRLGQ